MDAIQSAYSVRNEKRGDEQEGMGSSTQHQSCPIAIETMIYVCDPHVVLYWCRRDN